MKIVFVNNSLVPYRHNFFKYFFDRFGKDVSNSIVLYLTRKESIREWREGDTDQYPTVFLKKIYQSRNIKTTTSDYIINYDYLHYLHEADVLFTLGYSYTTYLIMCIYAKLRGVKTVCFCETNISDKPRGKIFSQIKKTLLNYLYDCFAVPGDNAKKYLVDLGIPNEKIKIIGNSAPFMYDTKHYLSECSKVYNDSESIKVLYVGRMSEEKNIEFALHELEKIDKLLEITLVGNGPIYSAVMKIANNSKHTYKIIDFIDRELLPRIYLDNDILLLPSYSETWGLVVNEAIEFGLAVIASNHVGCVPELIDGNGVVFDLNKKGDFIEKFNDIITHYEKYKLVSKSINALNNKEHNADRMMECLHSLLG